MHPLNNEQQNVKNAINSILPGERLVVSGRAGSGKTYAIAHSVADRKALFLAPTHPARTVLEQELIDKRHEVMTIHSAIGWYQYRDADLNMVDNYLPAKEAKRRSERTNEKKTGLFSDVDIIIVDEFSMVGSFLFGAIEEYAREFDLPVVYSGDRFQLPPVKDREVIMDQGFKTITLNCSMRFPEDSEIFRLGEMLRNELEQRPNGELPCIEGNATVQVKPGMVWMNALIHGYAANENLLAVTSDNKTLHRLRQKVRQVGHDRLNAGDLVISKQTDDLFRNGEQLTVSRIESNTQSLEDVPGCVRRSRELSIQGFSVTFEETDRIAFVLDDDRAVKNLEGRIHRLFEKGKLNHDEASRVLDWIDQVNSFELSSLATVHKSQGRSVDTVYIDTGTVLRKPNWLSPLNHKRMLYTAVTRARKQVVFYEMLTYCEQAVTDLPLAA